MNTVSQLLANKALWKNNDHASERAGHVQTIAQSHSVLDAARLMNECHIGSLLVTDSSGAMTGIISERDILTRVIAMERIPSDTRVSDVMTAEVVNCDSTMRLTKVRQLMTDCRIRHLPVIDSGNITGMISIGDLNAAANADLSAEVISMREYITSQ